MSRTDNLEHQLLVQAESAEHFFWHRLRWFAIERNLPPGNPQNFLDIGAGHGLFAKFIKSDFPHAKYHFIEPTTSLESNLEKQFGPERNLKNSQSFTDISVITLLDVLEHIENDSEFLSGVIAKMAPGSTMVITVPAMSWLWSQWDTHVGHLRRYDRASMMKLLEPLKSQVDILENSYLFFELVPAMLWRGYKLRRSSADTTNAASESEVPYLPKLINDIAYIVGRIAYCFRRLVPFGGSLLVVLRKKKTDE